MGRPSLPEYAATFDALWVNTRREGAELPVIAIHVEGTSSLVRRYLHVPLAIEAHGLPIRVAVIDVNRIALFNSGSRSSACAP